MTAKNRQVPRGSVTGPGLRGRRWKKEVFRHCQTESWPTLQNLLVLDRQSGPRKWPSSVWGEAHPSPLASCPGAPRERCPTAIVPAHRRQAVTGSIWVARHLWPAQNNPES